MKDPLDQELLIDQALLKLIDEREQRAMRRIADIIMRAHMMGRHEFAERLERYARERDLLPRGEKAN